MRPDLLPENNLERDLQELEAIGFELKGKQRIGSSSLVFFNNESDDQYDWGGTLPPSPQAPSIGTKILNVIATAKNMEVLYGEVIGYLFRGNPNTRYTQGNFLADIKAGNNYSQISLWNLPLNVSDKNKIAAAVGITGDLGTQYYAKFYVVASDEVDIEIVQVN